MKTYEQMGFVKIGDVMSLVCARCGDKLEAVAEYENTSTIIDKLLGRSAFKRTWKLNTKGWKSLKDPDPDSRDYPLCPDCFDEFLKFLQDGRSQ